VTRDGAKSWTNVVGNVPNLPKASWVSWVEASLYDAGTAYATFDRHTFGDMDPHVFKTTDFGKTWTPIIGANSGVRGYAHVIKEDTEAPNLLFLGTEFGLWISLDGGKHWRNTKVTNSHGGLSGTSLCIRASRIWWSPPWPRYLDRGRHHDVA